MIRKYAEIMVVVWSGLLLPSCASISLTDQIVPIDTNPRGLLVYRDRDSKKPLGKSPLLIKSAGESKERVFVGMPSGKREVMTHECDIRWLPAVAGNALVGAIAGPSGWAIAGLGMAWDFWKTGKGFDCTEFPTGRFNVKAEQKAVEPCLRYIVVPPYHFDSAFSDYIAKQWAMRAAARSDECVRFADYDQSKEMFLYLNLDNQREIKFENIGRQRSFELGQALRSSHFVFLSTKEESGVVKVVPQVYDIVRQAFVIDDDFRRKMTVDVPSVARLKDVTKNKLLIQSVMLIPNSMTFSQTNFTLDLTEQSNFKQIGSAKTVESLPSYLSNWGLTSVDHPQGYNIWDVAFQIYPTIYSSFQERKYQFETNALTGEIYDYHLKFMFVTGLFNAGATFHTPIGALRISLGTGVSYINSRDTFATTNQMAPLFSAGVSYTAFLSQNFFFYSEASSFSVMGGQKSSPVDNEFFRLSDWSVTSIGIGYFMPTLRGYARSVID